jgi:hypothetical protein
MGFFSQLVGNWAGAKAMQAGSELVIVRHTTLDYSKIPADWKRSAKNLIAQRAKGMYDEYVLETEFDAALLEVALYFILAERSDWDHWLPALKEALADIREAGEGRITPSVSLEVIAQTGG